MKVRELKEGEWRLLKQSRLDALKTDPHSFWETYLEAQEYPNEYWKDLASNLTSLKGSRMFIIGDQEHLLGFVFGIRNGDEYRVGSLWINPLHRNRKAGSKLIKHVISWAIRQNGKTSIRLWSPMDKTVIFYTKLGFTSSTNTKTHLEDGRIIVEMEYIDN